MNQRKKRREMAAWTQRDEILLYSCGIAEALRGGRDLSGFPEVLAPFPPPYGGDERLWGSGPFILSEFRAVGDGSWQTNGFVVAGTGALGMGMLAGSLVGNAAARTRARNAAAAATIPRWVPIDQGLLYVSQHGFHMHTPHVLSWSWQQITGASMACPGGVQFSGEGARGPICYLISSDWAELVFVTWALARHPNHPQMLSGGWLPPGWTAHAAAHSTALTALSPGPETR